MGFTQQQICKTVVSQPCRGGSVSEVLSAGTYSSNYSFGGTVAVALEKQENFQTGKSVRQSKQEQFHCSRLLF